MNVLRIDHINIRASAELIDRCRDFYVRVLGLREGLRPRFRSRGYWLYAGDAPVVHLSVSDHAGEAALSEPSESTRGQLSPDNGQPAALDHFAFACEGLDEVVARLESHGIAFTIDEVPERGQTQLFLKDPAGIGLELNFRG
jgi:catechol 2,3-dioxygenase-like lactoylglutathione lyase family enzyme